MNILFHVKKEVLYYLNIKFILKIIFYILKIKRMIFIDRQTLNKKTKNNSNINKKLTRFHFKASSGVWSHRDDLTDITKKKNNNKHVKSFIN